VNCRIFFIFRNTGWNQKQYKDVTLRIVAVTNAYPRELHAYRDITRTRTSSLHIRAL